MWDRYATTEREFDVGQDLSWVNFDTGVDAAVVVVADHLGGGIPLGREVVDPREQCAQKPTQESGIPTGDMKTTVLKIVAADAVGVERFQRLVGTRPGRHAHPYRAIERVVSDGADRVVCAAGSGVAADPAHQVGGNGGMIVSYRDAGLVLGRGCVAGLACR